MSGSNPVTREVENGVAPLPAGGNGQVPRRYDAERENFVVGPAAAVRQGHAGGRETEPEASLAHQRVRFAPERARAGRGQNLNG